jgi:hypothetical protein
MPALVTAIRHSAAGAATQAAAMRIIEELKGVPAQGAGEA